MSGTPYDCPHCLHEKVGGVEIPLGSLCCCMCREIIQVMPLVWEGEGA